MKIKQSYITEIQALVLAGFSGIMIYNGNWILMILGFILLFLNSYFVITHLKKNVIEEYLKLKNTIKPKRRK